MFLSAFGLLKLFAVVKSDDFLYVAGNSKAELANWDEAVPNDPSETIERAKAKIGSSKYSIVNYNCEHFANEVKYNRPVSKQARRSFLHLLPHAHAFVLVLIYYLCLYSWGKDLMFNIFWGIFCEED
ncbi:phospholipase A and acyltransferase 3-like [Physella acuta]|uniref:phospholipase A and acyltransferase 3-like n=1 Tax=Physella acuta TaxID=109671 RepID=UPI0027DC4390|nr:phospholipase A and acyltransferase 3-like [Physella acuta]